VGPIWLPGTPATQVHRQRRTLQIGWRALSNASGVPFHEWHNNLTVPLVFWRTLHFLSFVQGFFCRFIDFVTRSLTLSSRHFPLLTHLPTHYRCSFLLAIASSIAQRLLRLSVVSPKLPVNLSGRSDTIIRRRTIN
jgi:hypothetical protein